MKTWAQSIVVVLALSGSVLADDAGDLARRAADDLIAAATLLDETDGASDQIAALTLTVQAYERGLSALREGLRRAHLRQAELQLRLSDQDAELSGLLTLLQNVSREAESQSLLHPGGALPTIRAGTLTASLVPALQERASALQSDLDEMQGLIAIQRSGQEQMEHGVRGIRTARLRLVEAVSKRGGIGEGLGTDDAAIEALINSAETLSAFADSLLPDQIRSSWIGDTTWPVPVHGTVLRRYNDVDAAGVRRPGWVIATEPQALVITPAPATVRFSGDIPDQGGVVILEPEPGALVILAGMGSRFVQRDQIVDAGAPIGLMRSRTTREQEELNETFADSGLFGGETLYIEIRQGRTSVDPAGILNLGDE